MSMHSNLLATYNDLMSSLAALPEEIALAQGDLTEVKRQIGDSKTLLDSIEASLSLTIEGKNAEERKARLMQALETHQNYQRIKAALRKESAQADGLANDVDSLTRQYGAVSFQARLHAALLTYLGNASVHIAALGNDVLFTPPVNAPRTTGNGFNGTATVADAETLGL